MDLQIPTTALYYRLIDQIDASEFPGSHCVSKSILNLPVHQDVSAEDVSRICEEIGKFMSNPAN